MSFISLTLGKVSPKWRTLNEWLDVYEKVLAERTYSTQTLKNRLTNVQHIRRNLGKERMRSIRPLHITAMVRSFLPDRAPTSQRVRDEMVDVFKEAAANGWLDNNPAVHVRRPAAPVTKQRLDFKLWQQMRIRAAAGSVVWVEPLLLLAVVTGQRRGDLVKMRFDDVWDGFLHVEQQKKAGKKHGARVAIPLALRMDVLGLTVGEVIEMCRTYAAPGPTMLRKKNGEAFRRPEMLSYRFEECINPLGTWGPGERPSLHECRSLAARLYAEQGEDTQKLLGHKNKAMTEKYEDDRGLNAHEWKAVPLRVVADLDLMSSEPGSGRALA